MCYIQILVYSNNALWEKLSVCIDNVVNKLILTEKKDKDYCDGDFDTSGFEIVSRQDFLVQSTGDQITKERRKKFNLVCNTLEFSYFVHVLQCSRQFRFHVINFWSNKVKSHIPNGKKSTLCVTLVDPPRQVIDLNWCYRVHYLVMERCELDNAMSWLSTLGGAYSALGDHFTYCAQMAGRISIQQFQIALRLGDAGTVARCKLYIALSLIQTDRFKSAQHIIQAQYRLATNCASPDIRLIRMCRGIWSKLRYERSRHIEKKKRDKSLCCQPEIILLKQ